MVDAVIAVYLTNQRAGSPPGLVVAGPQGGKYYQENCRKKMGPNWQYHAPKLVAALPGGVP